MHDLIENAEALLMTAKLYNIAENTLPDDLYLDVLKEMILKFCENIGTQLKTK